MKSRMTRMAWVILMCLPLWLAAQQDDRVLDSLQHPLPAGTGIHAQTDQCRAVLWHIFRTDEYGYGKWVQRLDSLYGCCIAGKTGNAPYERTMRAELLFFKGTDLLFVEPEKAMPFLEEALDAYAALKDSTGIAFCYLQLTSAAANLGDSLMFDRFYRQANRLGGHMKEPYFEAMYQNNLAIPCYDFGLYAQAADHYFKALFLIEKYRTPELLEGERYLYQNLAGIYERLGDIENAVSYQQKAIALSHAYGLDDTDQIEALAWIYIAKNDYGRALELYEKIPDVTDPGSAPLNRIGSKTYGMAMCYRKLGALDKALPLAQKAVTWLPVERNIHFGGAALDELAQCEFATGMHAPAIRHALAALDAFLKGKNNRGAASSSELLMRIYEATGNYRKALEYSQMRYRLMDQIERQKSSRQLAFGEFTRNAEVEKARRNAEVKAELDQQRNIRYALLAGLAALALITWLLFNRFRLKQKTADQLTSKNREVEGALRRAEASEAFKSRFLANMSHEIRTPLHGIAGFTDLLLDTALSEKQRRWLSSIHHSTDRLQEVVNDILDLSKLEAGAVKLRQIPFSPAHVAADVRDALLLRAENKGLEMLLEKREQVPETVTGDPTRLYQILMNLAGNAIKFTENGSVRIILEPVELPGQNFPSIRFSVSDTGIGIPPEKLREVFESFRQADEDTTARFGGTGLGLTIARELVQLHGADIQVESTPGSGTTFSFVLALPPATGTQPEKGSTTRELYFSQPVRILIVDDHELNREIAVEVIARHFENAVVTEAANGREAVDFLYSGGYDLVLMDMQMPEMNGMEAARIIRRDISETLPIIALTASVTAEEIEGALASGMNLYLGKPFQAHELAQAVAGLLGWIAQPEVSKTPSDMEDTEGFDLRFLRDFCAGDEEQAQYFINRFMNKLPSHLQALSDAVARKDREEAYRSAHSFRPELEFVGLKKAAAQILEIETALREGIALEEISERLNLLCEALAAVPRIAAPPA